MSTKQEDYRHPHPVRIPLVMVKYFYETILTDRTSITIRGPGNKRKHYLIVIDRDGCLDIGTP